jgi:hypothetical protein
MESAVAGHGRILLSNHRPDTPAAAAWVLLHLSQLHLQEDVVGSSRKLWWQARAKKPKGACTIAAEQPADGVRGYE